MGIVEPIDLSNEIAKWKSAVYGKDVRAANTSAFEKIQTSVNGTVENVNQAAENAQNASKNAQDAVDRVQGAIDTATQKAEEAAASQLEAQKSETAAGEYKTAAGTSAVNAAKSAERAEAVKEQLGGFDGTAKTVKATDTYGIIASAMGESNAQALIDAVTNQVMNELLKKSQVVNNLLATIAGNALDAVQGKALSDKIVSLEEAYAQLNSDCLAVNTIRSVSPNDDTGIKNDLYGHWSELSACIAGLIYRNAAEAWIGLVNKYDDSTGSILLVNSYGQIRIYVHHGTMLHTVFSPS